MGVLRLEIREKVLLRSRGTCERCKVNKAEHMHHLTYARVGREWPSDIEHICIICHGLYHPHHKFRTKWEQRVMSQRRAKRNHKPKVPWQETEKSARQSLRKSARFNSIGMAARRGK